MSADHHVCSICGRDRGDRVMHMCKECSAWVCDDCTINCDESTLDNHFIKAENCQNCSGGNVTDHQRVKMLLELLNMADSEKEWDEEAVDAEILKSRKK